jgi:hypothetical protein
MLTNDNRIFMWVGLGRSLMGGGRKRKNDFLNKKQFKYTVIQSIHTVND